MDWTRVYLEIIDRARTRVIQKGIQRETHHIVPICMGGENTKENKELGRKLDAEYTQKLKDKCIANKGHQPVQQQMIL